MRAEFSEFSYGFALAFELMNAIQPFARGVPIFPSLRDEANVGFDVNFTPAGWPLFLQFKVAEYINRRGQFAGDHNNNPYFRVSLFRRNKSPQHQNLKELAITEPEVYYAAPAFIRVPEFNRFFANGEIFANTVFIHVNDVPDLPDDDPHYITFTSSATSSPLQFVFHSNHSQPFGHPLYGKEWLDHISSLTKQSQKSGWNYFYGLREKILAIARGNIIQRGLFDEPVITGDEGIDVIRDLRRLLFIHFGSLLILLQPDDGSGT